MALPALKGAGFGHTRKSEQDRRVHVRHPSSETRAQPLFMEQLYGTCSAHPNKLAVEIRGEPNAEAITYSDLLKRTARTATWLVSRGVEPGDRVAVCLPKSAAGLQLHLAACSMGAVSMPLNPSYSAAELEYLLLDSEARVLVAPDGPNWDQTVAKLIHSVPASVERINPSNFATKLPEPGMDLAVNRFAAGQTALILYTSGTTGRPKGACMSHASLTANMNMLGQAWGWRDDDVLLHVLPLFHVHGLLVALHGALHAGATCIMHSKFEARETLDQLRKGDCTVFMGVPTMYRRLLAAAGTRDCDFRHMRLMTSGSDRLPIDAFEQIVERFGVRVVERYGMTETGIMTSNPLDGDRVPGQVGLPLPGVEMRVVDPDTGSSLPSEEVGEFQTRGEHVFSEYWRDLGKTRESFAPGGWFRTGDLGIRDSSGRYEIKGRSSDLIISGGFNVYPSEVERALMEHPCVTQCAVVGLPDAEWGEAVTAYVVAEEARVTEPLLIQHCRQRLAGYKTPKRVEFVDRLPRNAMGKVQKSRLRATSAGSD